MSSSRLLLIGVSSLVLAGGSGSFGSTLPVNAGTVQTAADRAKEAHLENLKVTTTAFVSGAAIPTKYTADGEDIAPSLSWSAVPPQTKSIAVCVVDTDAPRGDWWHWVLMT